jgi:hypothetical protein
MKLVMYLVSTHGEWEADRPGRMRVFDKGNACVSACEIMRNHSCESCSLKLFRIVSVARGVIKWKCLSLGKTARIFQAIVAFVVIVQKVCFR